MGRKMCKSRFATECGTKESVTGNEPNRVSQKYVAENSDQIRNDRKRKATKTAKESRK